MNETPIPHDAPATPARPRRRGPIAPLPAVVVGLPIPALSGAALAGLSGALAWLGMRLRRRG